MPSALILCTSAPRILPSARLPQRHRPGGAFLTPTPRAAHPLNHLGEQYAPTSQCRRASWDCTRARGRTGTTRSTCIGRTHRQAARSSGPACRDCARAAECASIQYRQPRDHWIGHVLTDALSELRIGLRVNAIVGARHVFNTFCRPSNVGWHGLVFKDGGGVSEMDL